MNSGIQTLELAKLYESQGHYQEAHDIYASLDTREYCDHTAEIRAALERTQNYQGSLKASLPSRERVAHLLEKWLMLLVVKQRLENFKKIKARLL